MSYDDAAESALRAANAGLFAELQQQRKPAGSWMPVCECGHNDLFHLAPGAIKPGPCLHKTSDRRCKCSGFKLARARRQRIIG